MRYSMLGLTDKGKRKAVNQDSILLLKMVDRKNEENILAAVCDGMGGLEKGEVASRRVVELLTIWFRKVYPGLKENDNLEAFEDLLYESWEELLQAAHQELFTYSERYETKIGTTVTIMLLIKDRYYTAHIGDSRIYEINHNIQRLTRDQTLGDIVRRKTRRSSGILLQGLGASPKIRPIYKSGTINRGTVYLLCSDGMGNKIDDNELFKWFGSTNLDSKEFLYQKGQAIIKIARERGERDDISLLLIYAC